ncbi:M28 family peptidase [Acidipila sp. EB88]|uniref:M28 family peptidase n=1 Tax=Acidipila sp. EB88 TaxID=2305226 RepID=UPI001F37B620|nr:M28 family peptidase [Acidipila sp. EB88]
MHRTTLLFPSLLLATCCAVAQEPAAGVPTAMPAVPEVAGVPAAAQQAASLINPENLRAHVRFLASDLLEGRGPGKRGGELAAEYIATEFALNGLKPAGDNGTYFQKVDLYAVHTDEAATKFAFVPKTGEAMPLAYNTDFVTKDERGEASADIDAPIVFVGYGIDAPEYGWNDYKGVDVKGKILLVIVNEPASDDPAFFKGKTMTYYGRWTYKYEEAARLGAAGVLIIHRTDLASYPWAVVQNSQAIEKSYLKGDPAATLKAASWIQLETARKLMAASGLDLDKEIDAAGKRGFKPVELPVKLQAHIASVVRPYTSANVVAKVEGADTTPKQAVIYTGHYDHLGIDPNAKGDGIYNGAADNATGCAILLELGRAFAQSPTPPPHTVYFSSVTAEEQGLLGSAYLGMHTPVPAKDMALDLNYDELLPVGIPTSAEVSGSDRTQFYPVVEKTAQAFGLTIQPDQFPMAGSYYRSDHFSMARVGVPAFSIGEGTLFAGHDAAWGDAQVKDFTAHRYHQPADEYSPDMDFRGDARMAQFGLMLGWQASAGAPTEWKAGDEFEKARKAGR